MKTNIKQRYLEQLKCAKFW